MGNTFSRHELKFSLYYDTLHTPEIKGKKTNKKNKSRICNENHQFNWTVVFGIKSSYCWNNFVWMPIAHWTNTHNQTMTSPFIN